MLDGVAQLLSSVRSRSPACAINAKMSLRSASLVSRAARLATHPSSRLTE